MKKKLLITGCMGQLGRAVNRMYEGNDEYELINSDVQPQTTEDATVRRTDITDVDAVLRFAREVRPYAIVNCAAYTAVDACEKNKALAFGINAVGARNLAIAARETGAKLVHISTDYVFEGRNRETPYTEFDAVCPQSAYGRTKLAGEEFVKQFADRFFILRTAWLYGEGKNFVRTMLALSETHDELSVVCDQVGSPTSAAELARAIGRLLPTENYGTFHATCEGSCSWADFAEKIFALAGKKTRVRRVTTEEYKRMQPGQADRPLYSILENYMLKQTTDFMFADWKEALREYISVR